MNSTNKKFLTGIIKAIYLATVFAVACLCFSRYLNQGNVDMTMDMPSATLPVVHLKIGGMDVNYLYGYLNEMETGFMRDTLTIVDSDRKVDFEADTYGEEIRDMYFEVRSLDGSRLVEQTEVFFNKVSEDKTTGSFTLKDLIEDGSEYMLVLVLSTPDHEEVRYYTRLIWSEDLHVEEKVAYVYDFSDRTFDKERAKELTKYLESNSSGDNSSFMHVDIHSSFRQVTWGDLTVSRICKPRITISELSPAFGYFRVNYSVYVLEESGNALCNVTEYYRIRYTADRIYLLNWERNLVQVPDENRDIYVGDQIELGMADPDMELVESDGGNEFAFVDGGKLIGVSTVDHRVSVIYSFLNEDDQDLRCIHDEHRIHVLSVDETGDVEFMVYGYMNRGLHEGKVGISIYNYNSAYNTIEELAYVNYTGSASILMRNVDELSYADREGHQYFMLERSVYEVDSSANALTMVASALEDDSYKVSSSGQMLLWQSDGSVYDCTRLRLLNLSTGISEDVKAGYGEYVMPLGFMGEDMVYGLAKSRDVETDIDGTVIFPMYKIVIRNAAGEILKTYSEVDLYVMDCEFGDDLISLTRARRDDKTGRYEYVDSDQIVRTTETEARTNNLVRVVTEPLETIVQISMKAELPPEDIMILTPRETVTEGVREMSVDRESRPDQYYVYGVTGYMSSYVEAAGAINYAYANSGIVLDASGQYVWYKNTRSGRNQIMAITEPEQVDAGESMAACIDAMLGFEGITTNSRILLNQGQNAYQILEQYMAEHQVLNLTGCSLDAVLYYVNMDIPVLAIMEDYSAVLITGFNESQIVVYDPTAGELHKEGITEMDNAFRSNGYRFITYVK